MKSELQYWRERFPATTELGRRLVDAESNLVIEKNKSIDNTALTPIQACDWVGDDRRTNRKVTAHERWVVGWEWEST